jgi:predicted outer membrane repeat protein
MNNKKRLWLCFVVATGCAVLFGGCEEVSSLFDGGGGDEESEGGPSGGPVDNFNPSIPSFYVSAKEGKDDNNGTSESEPLATLKEAYKKIDSEHRRIVVLSDLTQANAVEFNVPGDFITIEGRHAGYTIGRSEGKNGSVLEITGGAKIEFVNIKVNGRNGSVYNRAIKIDGAGSEATLGQGAVLTGELMGIAGGDIIGGDLTLNGNGVWVTGGGLLTIAEGEVAGCQGTVSVGTVFANAGGSVSMTGGWILGNTAQRGGGIAVYQSAAFTMTGGEISGNTGIGGGGGIYAVGDNSSSDKRPTLTLDVGKILYNNATGNGGGVLIFHQIGDFTIAKDVVISNNIAANNGGGICVSDQSGMIKMVMTGGRISDNTASTSGGGIYATGNGTITMTGGQISGNKALSNKGGEGGGGVFVGYGKNGTSISFNMEGGEISGNYAAYGGGGVFLKPFGGATSTAIFTLKGNATVYGSNAPSSLLANSVGTQDKGAAIHKYSTGESTKVLIETTECDLNKQSFEDTVDKSYTN